MQLPACLRVVQTLLITKHFTSATLSFLISRHKSSGKKPDQLQIIYLQKIRKIKQKVAEGKYEIPKELQKELLVELDKLEKKYHERVKSVSSNKFDGAKLVFDGKAPKPKKK